MSEEDTAEDARYELGRDFAMRGEKLHDGASEEFVRGFSSYRGFGSNVTPRKFGQTGESRTDWECICGHVNKGRVRRKKAGRIVCWQCGLERDLSERSGS